MTDFFIEHIEFFASHAKLWGFFIIFFLMAVESSFIPFPSEVVMIPAGFMAARGELSFGDSIADSAFAIFAGLAGSLAGAWFNYYFALFLGRPFLYKYGKYFFIDEKILKKAEEVFNEYGDITTFICRLIPAIRQLISLPAGLAKMDPWRFTFFTALGAGIWTAILCAIGFSIGKLSGNISYRELIIKGKTMLSENYIFIFIALAAICAIYIYIHKKIVSFKVKSQLQNS
jgi:membrane protein DedA with SNARE-associated domain